MSGGVSLNARQKLFPAERAAQLADIRSASVMIWSLGDEHGSPSVLTA